MTVTATKSHRAALKAPAGALTDATLAAVNQFTLTTLSAEQVYVRTAAIAHNGIDRDREVFDDALLDSYAQTLPGKGFFVKHPSSYDGSSAPGVGRWFGARTLTMPLDAARALLREPNLQFAPGVTQAKVLEADFYMPRHAANEPLIANIDAGVAGDVSLGFRASERAPIKDAAGNTVAHRLVGPGEALEASLVWLGAQPGARITKQFNPQGEGAAMNETQVKELQDRVKALEGVESAYKALAAVLGEDLAKAPALLAKLITDGKAYRAELVDDVVRLERLAKLLGDTDANVSEAKTYLGQLPVEALRARRDALAKTVQPNAAQLGGGDPNLTGATGAAGDKAAAGPLGNALLINAA